MSSTVFLGTPEAAVPALHALCRVSTVTTVVTQPDRARGRSKKLVPPPVKVAAIELGLDVMQPRTMGEIREVAATCDIGILVAMGRIIPEGVLAAPRLGMVNIHFSLLPRWRGATPVEHAILAGDRRAGVTLMQMDAGLDTGALLSSHETLIGDDNAGTLTSRLAFLGADALVAHWSDLLAQALPSVPQDEMSMTLAPKLTATDAHIAGDIDGERAMRVVRAFSPKPGAWTTVEGRRFKILEVRSVDAALAPGVISEVDGVPVLGTQTSALELVVVQPADKPTMTGVDWFNGRRRVPTVIS